MHTTILLTVINAQYVFQLEDMMTLIVGKMMKAYSLRIALQESSMTIIS